MCFIEHRAILAECRSAAAAPNKLPLVSRLESQITFLLEADRLKGVLRQAQLTDGSRFENSAEHSWHFALALAVLAEHAPPETDLLRMMKMAVIHDLVEIDAGDTFVYDVAAQQLRAAREQVAADRIFSLLPADQAVEFRALWDEFEAGETVEAQFANALDRLCAILLNNATQGGGWRRHGISAARVRERNLPSMLFCPPLHSFVAALIDNCVAQGYIQE